MLGLVIVSHLFTYDRLLVLPVELVVYNINSFGRYRGVFVCLFVFVFASVFAFAFAFVFVFGFGFGFCLAVEDYLRENHRNYYSSMF